MPRHRVLSFMSQWGQPRSNAASPEPDDSRNRTANDDSKQPPASRQRDVDSTASPQTLQQKLNANAPASPRSTIAASRARADSRAAGTRPNSMIQTYQPAQMDLAQDTPPELLPIFTYLNSHSNKLYQEGYFLKLHDLDTRGRPSQDRVWTECFAQLAGTVLSLWDAAALDQAGEDGEVVPTFINLSDASIRMIESLPMNGIEGGNLQNVLSISTAANNRYLLHFNSLNSLTQWTAGIRLAMFEHSTLQEAYTGSLIAGKGKYLNNIKQIMERSKFPHEDWARVRFGSGTPWKRCWCVVTQPDEKEYQKAQKTLKKSSTYSRAQIPKGDIKFYDTRKITKKTRPIATITDAYAAYAIYPQSKPLIDQSTLVKLEGLVTVHTGQETTTEGFVFVMPEVHPAVSGFEMMLRWLFPAWDTFALYGRPNRLIADTLDQRGLMFAMPKDRRYGHLDILDVSGLIHTKGSQNWSERQWRIEMKKLTSARMMNSMEDSPRHSRQMGLGPRRNTTSRNSLPPGRTGVQFQEPVIHSSPGSRSGSPVKASGLEQFGPPRRTDSAPPQSLPATPHKRSASDVHGYRRYMADTPSRLSHEAGRDDDDDEPPVPPRHGGPLGAALSHPFDHESVQHMQSDDLPYEEAASTNFTSPEPVISPPALQHNPNSRPPTEPYQDPELRRAQSNVDAATLRQMQDAVRPTDDEVGVALPYRNTEMPARDDRQRLDTIPASPFVVNNTEYFAGQETVTPQMQGVMDPQVDQTRDHTRSNQSISRKPLPKPQQHNAEESGYYPSDRGEGSQVRETEPTSPVSTTGSFYDAVVDQEALERILENSGRASTFASSATPDYASANGAAEHETKITKPREWQRPGKLKTVGDPDLPSVDMRSGGTGRLDTYNKDLAEHAAALPTVDFGPTFSYKPNSRPTTGGAITPGEMERRSRSRSADRLRQSSGSRLSGYFPNPGETNRQSYFGGRSTPTGIEATAASPSQRHSIAWTATPGSGSPNNATQDRQTLTAEEWVQYRAMLAAQPQAPPRRSPVNALPHHRDSSYSSAHRQSMTKTPPPFSRSPSGDWSKQGQNLTPPSRPNSRGAGTYLNNQSSATLSAKEQMHVSRTTGTPLLSIAAGGRKQEEQAPGLIGALAAREREKEAVAQGVRGAAVQQAIAARQQQQQQQQMQMEAEAYARMQYNMPDMYQGAPQQATYAQQMAYMGAQAAAAQQQQQQQLASMQQQQQQRSHSRAQSSLSMTGPQVGGFGGQFAQQQGYFGNNSPVQQGQQNHRWQPPARR